MYFFLFLKVFQTAREKRKHEQASVMTLFWPYSPLICKKLWIKPHFHVLSFVLPGCSQGGRGLGVKEGRNSKLGSRRTLIWLKAVLEQLKSCPTHFHTSFTLPCSQLCMYPLLLETVSLFWGLFCDEGPLHPNALSHSTRYFVFDDMPWGPEET